MHLCIELKTVPLMLLFNLVMSIMRYEFNVKHPNNAMTIGDYWTQTNYYYILCNICFRISVRKSEINYWDSDVLEVNVYHMNSTKFTKLCSFVRSNVYGALYDQIVLGSFDQAQMVTMVWQHLPWHYHHFVCPKAIIFLSLHISLHYPSRFLSPIHVQLIYMQNNILAKKNHII